MSASPPSVAAKPSAPRKPRQEASARPETSAARAPRPKTAFDDISGASPEPETAAEKHDPAPPSPSPDPAPRPLDPAVADVLREEAEFEASQRLRDQSHLETQEELGLFGPVDSGLAPVSGRSGASSLPDIDDISSTLEPIETGRAGQTDLPQTGAARKRSFLAGLGVPLVLLFVLTGLYLGAPTLAGMVPALEGVLGGFVGLVDRARLAVAGLLGVGP